MVHVRWKWKIQSNMARESPKYGDFPAASHAKITVYVISH